MQATSEVPIADVAPATARPPAPIVRCGEDSVAVSLPSSLATSSLNSTEARLVRFVEIGFRRIEVIVDEAIAADPAVSAMLSRVAGCLANTGGEITIRTSGPQLIG